MTQYNGDCPSVCPSRDMMLCVRCNHGVFRTFMSTCHVKMFRCQHPEEKLSLVSRQPCILSAPFLPESSETQGRVVEPGDEDVVLRYIRCKKYGRLEGGDMKCKFDELQV
ncbi:uncharacterized protein LOC126973791 [Leptidea sinapis]|uniref:uncharacterized protein LOC126973791 n=1 Tax=Leptidea sinapis TaxID=189913 RepID=UPI0021C3471E|nr:uncharacterized protein LOC126973791 [Leptidea sinapis]